MYHYTAKLGFTEYRVWFMRKHKKTATQIWVAVLVIINA